MTVRPGTVYLVGAGPGDPGLITVRGRALLRRADVVLHDRLVDDALLAEAPADALLEDVGKASRGESMKQDGINEALVRHARAGRVVVRLKGGDPFVFGRGWEEREACRAAGIACEVVPGISSALAAPAAAGVAVTRRGVASSVTITSGPAILSTEPEALPRADTLVVLMGVAELPLIAHRLVAGGLDAATPATIIERATTSGERLVTGPLSGIADLAADARVEAPAVLVVGRTAAPVLEARVQGALTNCRVLVTRPPDAAHTLVDLLRACGADVIAAPLIRIEYRVTRRTNGRTGPAPGLARLIADTWDSHWIAFTSRHGVRGFRQALEHHGADVRALGHSRIASVGPVTSRELRAWGIRPDVEPSTFRADALVEALLAQRPRPRHVLFPCGTLARDTLPQALRDAGIDVEPVEVYDTVELPLDARVRAAIEQGVHAILLASPSAARALARSGVDVGDAVIVCIGETTAREARAAGWNVRVAGEHSDAGLVTTLHELQLAGATA